MTASFPSDLFSLVAEHHSFRTVLLCDGAPFLLNYFTLWLHEHHLLQNCSPLWLSTISCRTVLLYLWLHHPLWLSIILSELIYLVMERHSFRNVLPCDWTPSPAELFYLISFATSSSPSELFYIVTEHHSFRTVLPCDCMCTISLRTVLPCDCIISFRTVLPLSLIHIWRCRRWP